MINTYPLRHSYYFSSENAYIGTKTFTVVSLNYSGHVNNYTQLNQMNSDQCITARGIIPITGQSGLVIWASWGDAPYGVNVGRVNDDGTITELWGDTCGTSNQDDVTNIAFYEPSGFLFSSKYATTSYTKHDLTPLYTGGTPSRTNVVDSTQYGYAYKNGFFVVGDYLYMAKDNPGSTTQQRLHIPTNSIEDVIVNNYRNSNLDASITFYEEAKDRLFCSSFTNGEIWVIDNASMPTGTGNTDCQGYCLRVRDTAEPDQTDDTRWGLVIPLSGEEYILGTDRRFSHYDISGSMNPSVLSDPVFITGSSSYFESSVLANFYGDCFSPDIENYPKYRVMGVDRDYVNKTAWIDAENYSLVGLHLNRFTDYFTADNTPLEFDYGPSMCKVTTSGAIDYYCVIGYGGPDGGKIYTYSFNPYLLSTSGHIIFGPFILEDGSNIGGIKFENYFDNLFLPSGTSANAYIGEDLQNWTLINNPESLNYTEPYGECYIKLDFSGRPDAAPYIMTFEREPVLITLVNRSQSQRKQTQFRLLGGS